MIEPFIKRTVYPLMLIAVLGAGQVAAGAECRQGLAPGAVISKTPRRLDVELTRQHDDPAIRQALLVLGQAVNPITVVDLAHIRQIYARTPGVGAPPAGLDAFRSPGDDNDPNIYVNGASVVYMRAARNPTALAVLKLAATLVHEQVHNTDGEFAAYRLQSDFVRSRLKSVPGHQQEELYLYLAVLDARAFARQNSERRARQESGIRNQESGIRNQESRNFGIFGNADHVTADQAIRRSTDRAIRRSGISVSR